MARRNYIYDIDTNNLSFLQTASDLKKLGRKNCMFFLKLYDTSLRGIDPYDLNLTDDYIIRIVNECIINPWYFLREVARIPDQGNPKGVPYRLDRANLAATWCFLNGIDYYEVIPRQIGKTQSNICLLDWSFLFGTTNSEFMFINTRTESAVENLGRLKDQRDLLPSYLQFKLIIGEDGKPLKATDNVRTLENSSNGNRIVTKPQARSVASAEKIGRGSTQPIQYYDEFEFIDHIKTIMEAAGPAFNTASSNAKRNNSMYGRIITSTPGDLDTPSGQDALQIIENTATWSEEFYDKGADAAKEYLEKNSANGIMYIEYSYQQLGKDEAWFRRVCQLVNNNPVKIKREILLMRMRGSSMSPYDAEDLAAIEERMGKIIEEIFINNVYKLDVYTKLDRQKCYFIGVDVANGYGEDNSAVTIFDPYTLKPVAEFKSANIGVKALIKFLYTLVKKYLPRSILAIERNANGEAVLEFLSSSDIRPNVYFDSSKDIVGQDIDDKLDAQGFLKREAAKRKLRGIWTGGASRERMFSLLEGHIKDHKDKFVTHNIIDDLMKLVRTSSGKIEAGKGFHDDSIMSYLMCLYLYYYGNNLQRFGYVRGSLPDKEKRNHGLTYEDVEGLLSENDKKFFENVSFDNKNEAPLFDIKTAIESTRGLISEEELREQVPHKQNIPKSNDPYLNKIHKEMIQAQKESEAFNRSVNFTNTYENMDVDMDDNEFDDYDLSIFDDLNS